MLDGAIMGDREDQTATSEQRLHLLSKELEEATEQFLSKMEELEKLLVFVDE
jgi:hypothetical protein